MSKPVKTQRGPSPKKRAYSSVVRTQQAAQTRARIVDAAAELFVADGYGPTTIRAIAERAEVAPDTVYATFGSKVRVLTAVIDARLAPAGQANVTERPEALAVRDEPDQRAQLRRFSRDIAAVSARVRPIYEVLRTASAAEPEVAAVFAEMDGHRLANMGRLVDWLLERGPLRVPASRAAEIVWALASPDVARMLCDVAGWTEDEHAAWLEESLAAALLEPAAEPAADPARLPAPKPAPRAAATARPKGRPARARRGRAG